MTERYVEDVMRVVEAVTRKEGINDLIFWDWLGNTKFAGDHGDLTPERASQITREIETLLREFYSR